MLRSSEEEEQAYKSSEKCVDKFIVKSTFFHLISVDLSRNTKQSLARVKASPKHPRKTLNREAYLNILYLWLQTIPKEMNERVD